MGLITFIETLGRKAEKEFLPMQPGDVRTTYADSSDLMDDVGYQPDTPLAEGLEAFVDWYRRYYAEAAAVY